ncbi:hypothetical protein R1sor_002805 [Riccia sorocarpa]|uniref:Uncharacterized protein n=1 Tax=Riccia sorocarpa TaxID=122646 RepID=A0ABD3GZT7_9MARC
MAPTFPEAEKDVRLRAVGGDEAAKFRSRLRNDIELQLESATGKLFALESNIANAVYAGNKEGTIREIYDAHGNSQDARYHIRKAMQLVNAVLAPDDDSLDGRWKSKFGELEAIGEERAMEGKVEVDVSFFKARWDLGTKSIYISERTVSNGEVLNYLVNRSVEQQWTLEAGKRYIVRGVVDSLPTDVPRTTVSSLESPLVSSIHHSTIEDFGSCSAPLLSWVGIPNDPTVISSFRALRQLHGRSELSRLELPDFAHQLVVQLLDMYNGNVIFEIPPKKPEEILKKGAILEGMDRTHDCWSWTKCTTTSAVIGLKRSEYTINKIACVGS